MMKKLNDYVDLYKKQLEKGDIQKAYTALVKYVTKLGSVLSKNLSDSYTFGSLFQGYMDYTYFYYSNDFLKKRKLRFGLVLNHQKMRFEIWLLGQNLKIQDEYWLHFKNTKWNENRTIRPQYSILETVLIESPNFNDLEALTEQIEKALIAVSNEIIGEIQKSKLE
ncbi:DUF7000 family protein [Flavobacterium microcysteis]|uniref:DUF7000 domain-containing protein n=1 Tax=Flavobacterium microcysteis TaxID=2596891 RepID=A0A501Q152_9FLAO|nr:hypothetical protein [Flavobacterium microcysteis]TPD66064.1 hypothetical protein FJA49_17990 [Flavobacterium microcysteis]